MSVTTVDTSYAAAYERPISYRKTQLAYDALASRDQRLNSRQRQLLLLIDRRDDSVTMIVQSLMTDDNLNALLHYGLIEPVYEQPPVLTQPTIEANIHQPPERLSDAEVERQLEAAKRKADWSKPAAKLYDWFQSDQRRTAEPPAAERSVSVEPVQVAPVEMAPAQAAPVPVEPVPTSVAAKTEFILTDRPVPSFLAEPEPESPAPIPVLVELVQPAWQPMDFEALQLLMRETLWQTCGLMGKPLLRKIEAVTTVAELRRLQPQWKTSILEVRYREQSDALKQALLNVSENLARL
ncbi:MAG: hypothetical protein WA154_04505 [Moraxellaceae bacterium]